MSQFSKNKKAVYLDVIDVQPMCLYLCILSSFENVDSAIAEMGIFGFQKVPF